MSGQEPERDYQISKNRVEALVDGIFAFAMTLLVVGLTVPILTKEQAATELPARVIGMHTEFFSFFIAFFILASFWLLHHRQFHFVRTIDPLLVRLNLLILAFIVLMPFTTNLSGDYSNVPIAVDLFHFNMLIIGTLFLCQWYYLVHHPKITSAEISTIDAANGIRRGMVMPFVAMLGICVSFFSPSNSMICYLLIPVLFVVIGMIGHSGSQSTEK
ncbi:MAG: TMEM175 family protein [Methanoregula sp.]|nr:MAG: TMEM175 family protein [Methanoregula sp.]